MNISTSAQKNPALILLQATLQLATRGSPVGQPSGDSVEISAEARHLSQRAALPDS